RAAGYRAGINVLATIGHHDENLPYSLDEAYTRVTDLDGAVCRGCFCPNDEGMQGYVKRLYELVASAGPDYIWVDDDVRFRGHMPIRETCFCDTCLAIFARERGVDYTRESLRDALNTGPVAQRLELRRAWLQHARDSITRLLALIERTVHGLRPGLPLGFMTGDRFFEGYDFDTWAETLAGGDGAEVLWRPGGGTYTEEAPDAMADKAHAIGRQTALLPESVRRIQSELESFPYQRLRKSIHFTTLEASGYVAGGCTGTAFNVLSQYDEPLDEFEPLVAGLRRARPFLDVLVREFGRSRPAGLYSGWGKDTAAAINPEGAWHAPAATGAGTSNCNEILSTGIPAAYAPPEARVTALCGDSVLALDDAAIRRALSSGAYMDGAALTRLNEMGYGEWTGFRVARVLHEDCIEQFTAHPLNGAFARRLRNGRQSFWKCPAYELAPTDDAAQTVSRLVDYAYCETAGCCMGVFENRLGGRICVAGCYPWSQLQNLSKSAQLKSVMRWLSKDTLPGWVASFHRANLWVREPAPGRLAAALVNASLDPAERLALMLRTDNHEAAVYDVNCDETRVAAESVEGPYRRFVLPPIGPWHVCLITV
ncbi:MAG: hypothetical protein JXR94_22240, partial [Candidatus Hydrogenedentes bacterium]|nr:hypothetical protein [Candidatus Hydrogenedentota bacterium]